MLDISPTIKKNLVTTDEQYKWKKNVSSILLIQNVIRFLALL